MWFIRPALQIFRKVTCSGVAEGMRGDTAVYVVFAVFHGPGFAVFGYLHDGRPGQQIHAALAYLDITNSAGIEAAARARVKNHFESPTSLPSLIPTLRILTRHAKVVSAKYHQGASIAKPIYVSRIIEIIYWPSE
jgi:hypothetical protein